MVFWEHVRRAGIDMQPAETATKIQVRLDAGILVTKKDDQMVGEGRVDLLELPVAERLR